MEQDLYSGFVGNEDRRRLNCLRALPPEELARDGTGFDDGRLAELVWRYRARNFPQTLTPEDQERWEAHRQSPAGGGGRRPELDALFSA